MTSKQVPFAKLGLQYLAIHEELDAAISNVLHGGDFILGQEVSLFEKEFSHYCQTAFGAGVASGTDALTLALRACEIGPGHEVITSVHTAVATIAAIELTGARPVLVDIQADGFTIDTAKITTSITRRTRAIIPVHIYGAPAELAPILDIAGQHGLYVIEDCAQAHGALYHDKRVGAWGHLAAFSFYPTKNLGAFGDAGMVLTSDQGMFEKLTRLRQYGWQQRYVSDTKGINSRLDNLQAAILRVKLPYLDKWNDRRIQIARSYDECLSTCDVHTPATPPHSTHVYHQYVIRSKQRGLLQAHLMEQGIQTGIHYPVPIHLQPAYRDLGYVQGEFPNAEAASREILSLPIYPELTDVEMQQVCTAIRQYHRVQSS
jgi:dTDP-4-amino-4,6-dideoxygalactose transaminase